ncbi:MAG: ATP-binding protein, partial [Bacilli bacterium]
GDAASSEAKDNWITVANSYIENIEIFSPLKDLVYHTQNKAYRYDSGGKKYINDKSDMTKEAIEHLELSSIEAMLSSKFNESNQIERLKFHLDFQKVHQSAWKSTSIEHLNPLFNRINTSLTSINKVINIVEDISNEYKTLNIVSLVNANQEVSRLIPMLLSKMIYGIQKKSNVGKDVTKTKHLIIDEAHNILNAENRDNGDAWQDYRLSVFEEIIKEGRKFGFYLTLSSQRPYDISATILSQVHNYFIHRLVNEKDLRMLENTMPTLDRSSYYMIPSLGQGEAIVTGNAIKVPVFLRVEKEEETRPNSDDVVLTTIWKNRK